VLLEDLGDLHRAAVDLEAVVGGPDDPELAPVGQAVGDHGLVALLEDVQRHDLVREGDHAQREEWEVFTVLGHGAIVG
jgi:hypothetical protein